MGYFSNGTEGMDYEAEYCDKCVHMQDEHNPCAVLMAHMILNYDECNNKDSILHMLIPRGESGGNKKCKMFMEASKRVRDI